MLTIIRHRTTAFSAKAVSQYRRLLTRFGLDDTTETRVVAAVAVSVVLWYACVVLDALVRLITQAAATYSNIVHS